jgi:hypothetical protein
MGFGSPLDTSWLILAGGSCLGSGPPGTKWLIDLTSESCSMGSGIRAYELTKSTEKMTNKIFVIIESK